MCMKISFLHFLLTLRATFSFASRLAVLEVLDEQQMNTIQHLDIYRALVIRHMNKE